MNYRVNVAKVRETDPWVARWPIAATNLSLFVHSPHLACLIDNIFPEQGLVDLANIDIAGAVTMGTNYVSTSMAATSMKNIRKYNSICRQLRAVRHDHAIRNESFWFDTGYNFDGSGTYEISSALVQPCRGNFCQSR